MPRKTQKPEIDRLLSGQEAQSESEKLLSWRDAWAEKKSPFPGEPLIYLSTRWYNSLNQERINGDGKRRRVQKRENWSKWSRVY